MGRKKMPGLVKRGNIWHINKKVNGCRISESTGSGSLKEAERYLVHRLEQIRQASVYGVRPKRTFREAATKYLLENQHKASLHVDVANIKFIDKFIGDLTLDGIHMGTLQTYIDSRRKEGVKTRTINHGLQIVRRILNLAAGEWLDEYGLTWLAVAPKIRLFSEVDRQPPYPLDQEEQARLFSELPLHLRQMALFAVNTGCRDQEVCHLQWQWETKLTGNNSVFIIPGEFVKNRKDRLVVLNDIAYSVVNQVRGFHPKYVFTYQGNPITRMLNSAWLKARSRAELSNVRVHDLKHTFGRRLRAVGVSFEDRQDLLGHKSHRITTHYSQAELSNLISAANKVCGLGRSQLPMLALLKNKVVKRRAKVAQGNFRESLKVL